MAARFSFAPARGLVFGYRVGGPADPIASRPRIPAPPPWAGDPATGIDGPLGFRRVRTPIGIACVARTALFAIGLGALYGVVLAMTSGLVDTPNHATAPSPVQSVAQALAAQPQPETAAAQAGERVGRELIGALRVESAPKKL